MIKRRFGDARACGDLLSDTSQMGRKRSTQSKRPPVPNDPETPAKKGADEPLHVTACPSRPVQTDRPIRAQATRAQQARARGDHAKNICQSARGRSTQYERVSVMPTPGASRARPARPPFLREHSPDQAVAHAQMRLPLGAQPRLKREAEFFEQRV